MLVQHLTYLLMMRFIHVKLNDVSRDWLFFLQAVIRYALICQVAIDCLDIFNIDIAFL